MLPETPAPGTFAALRIFSRLRLFLRFRVDKPFCKFPGLSRCSMLAPGDPLGICDMSKDFSLGALSPFFWVLLGSSIPNWDAREVC